MQEPQNTGELVDNPGTPLYAMVADADAIYEVVDHVNGQINGQPLFFERWDRQTNVRTELFHEPAVEAGSPNFYRPELWQTDSLLIAGRRESGAVEAVPKQGGEPMTLWSKPFDEIATSDTQVFLLAQGKITELLSKQALAPVPSAVKMALSPSDLVVATSSELVRVPLDGGAPVMWTSGFTSIQALVVDETFAYVADGDSVIRVSAAGEKTPIVTKHLAPYRLALVGSSQLAFVDRGKLLDFSPSGIPYKSSALRGLFLVSREGGDPATLACAGAEDALIEPFYLSSPEYRLSTSGDSLFWISPDGAIYTVHQP